MSQSKNYKHVKYLWDDSFVSTLDPLGRLIYRSNLLGADPCITNTGGGNTSSKVMERDPLTNEEVEVLWIKGSGGDLRTAKRENFSSLYQQKLIDLQKLYASASVRGPKTEAEDKMVEMYSHTTFNLNPRPSSIDTPLHAFAPYKHVDHTHPNSVIAVAASRHSEALTKEIYGDDVIWTPWQRPGFELGLIIQEICEKHPNAKGVVLGQHGLISWSNDDKECYELSLELIEKAALYIESHDNGRNTFGGQKYFPLDEHERRSTLVQILPWLRGQVSKQKRVVGTIQDDENILRFVNSNDAPHLAELGTSCPDHFLRTKIKPLYIDWSPQTEDLPALKEKLAYGFEKYRIDYAEYYGKCKHNNSPAIRDPNPTVILIPGLGMIAWGKDKSESRVTAEFYNSAVEVMRGAEAIDEYIALPEQEAFDIEYWLLEEAKLQRMPAEKELARRIVTVTGAGSELGKELAHHLAKEGATVACLDTSQARADATAKEITDIVGTGIGIAGSDISGCGQAVGVACNPRILDSVQSALEQIVIAYGGLDSIYVIDSAPIPPERGKSLNSDDQWLLGCGANLTEGSLITEEVTSIWREQNLPTSLAFAIVDGAVPGKPM